MHRHCHSRSIPQMENAIHCARCCECWLFDWIVLYYSGEYNLNIFLQRFGHKSNRLMFFLSFKSSGRSIHLEFGWFLRGFVHCVHYGHCRIGSCLLDLRWVEYTNYLLCGMNKLKQVFKQPYNFSDRSWSTLPRCWIHDWPQSRPLLAHMLGHSNSNDNDQYSSLYTRFIPTAQI